MKSKSWLRRSVLVFGISLVVSAPAPAQSVRPPAVAVVDPADAVQWQSWVKDAGFTVISGSAADNADARAQSLAAAVQKAIDSGTADPARIYLVGRGPAAWAVFYIVSRVPDLWAAALAVEGSPQPAIDTDRIFAANFTNVPTLWVTAAPGSGDLAARLKAAGLNLTLRPLAGFTNTSAVAWFNEHRRDASPLSVDCETNSPAFGNCYWIHMTKFDPNERNDVLPSSRILAAYSPVLDLGAISYNPDDPGPGLLVSGLPDNYRGRLRLNDRLVALDGRTIGNARQLGELLARYTEDRTAVVMVQRGDDRVRVETRVILPRREAIVSARVQARYIPEEKVIQIVSRAVKEMRATIPPAWTPDSTLYWNGLVLEKVGTPGCILLSIENELLHAARCP